MFWIEYDTLTKKEWPQDKINETWQSFETLGFDLEKGSRLAQEGFAFIRFTNDLLVSFLQEGWMTQIGERGHKPLNVPSADHLRSSFPA